MARELIMLACVVLACQLCRAQDIPGETIPRNVPPVKLFEELNYSLPELAPIKAAVDAGDEQAAAEALLAYYRTKPDCQTPAKANPEFDTHLADELLKGNFIWGDTQMSYGPSVKDIEWYKVPMHVHWPLFDHEIGRGTYIVVLSNAYRNTAEDRYVQHLLDMILEFIEDCPVEDGRAMRRINNMDGLAVRDIGREALATEGHPAMMWTLMAAMRRAQLYPRIWQYCIQSPAFTPEALVTILTSFVEHQRYILDAMEKVTRGNHGTRTAVTALELAAKAPEFIEREAWADRALADTMRRYNWKGTHETAFIYPDGATEEISVEVGRGDYGTLVQALQWLEMLGRETPAQLLEVQEKMIEYYAWLSFPGDLSRRAARGSRGPGFDHRPDIEYIESGGKVGSVPEQCSYPLRSNEPYWAGTYFMRGDWTPQAVALRVRFGPIQYKYSMGGMGDVGEVGVWGHGMHLIPHIHMHPSSGEFMPYGDRSFAGDGRSHNTISINGIGQGRYGRVRYIEEPLDNPWVTNDVIDYVRGSYTFDPEQVRATHTRAIVFIKPDYFVVIDRITGDGGPHQYRMKYQLHPDLQPQVDGARAVGVADGQPRIIVAPTRGELGLSVITGQKEPEYEGWHLVSETDAVAAPALIYEWEQQAPAAVETVLWPIAPGADADIDIKRTVADGVTTLVITRGDDVDTVTIADDHSLSLERRRGGEVVGEGAVDAMGGEVRP